jgi:hypothetical protein
MVRKFQLEEEARILKEAFVFMVALLGAQTIGNDDRHLIIPNYSNLGKGALRKLIRDLRSDIDAYRKAFFANSATSTMHDFCINLSNGFRRWRESDCLIWEFGRVFDVERRIGPLPHRKTVECPPYAQVLIQGYIGSAIRHPEYHLAKDLALHMNLLFDAEQIAKDLALKGIPHNSEVNQSLARSVVLACYNLLEAFTSGLIVASRYERPNLSQEAREKLDNPGKRRSLKCRFEDVPSIISGKPDAMAQYRKTLLEPLFSEHKWRRDAFVHCEPGDVTSRHELVKEDLFHDVEITVIRETVDLTLQAIREAWAIVYQRSGPKWLPQSNANGRFNDISVGLTLRSQ